ncbi:phage tail protein [Desulfovibrio sp. OttesenSCG-928-G15]|nr:phage tail protein [Desulfovibrio sp. OttesenSCG-928-G15]
MALKEYIGAVTFEHNGREFEIVSLSVEHDPGRKPVKTMNSTGRSLGFYRDIKAWNLSITAAIPKDDSAFDWDNMEGGKVTVAPVAEGGKRISYLDCYSTKVSDKYEIDNEARIDVEIIALNKIEE